MPSPEQFPQGIPWAPGPRSTVAPDGTQLAGSALPADLQRLSGNATALTRSYDGVSGQAVTFGPFKTEFRLVRAVVVGPLGSRAFIYVGPGAPTGIVIPSQEVDYTPAGFNDIASYGFSPIPVFDTWSIVVFWDRPLTWGQGTAEVYVQEIGS